MASTFSQIYIQVVFAVKCRASLIHASWEEALFKYITGIVQHRNQKMLAINGVADHIHFLFGMRPSCCLSDLIREVKKSSNEFINKNKFSAFEFKWQEGYGAFSYSHSALNDVINYIQLQKAHHQKQNFKEEYTAILASFQITPKEAYLFEWIE